MTNERVPPQDDLVLSDLFLRAFRLYVDNFSSFVIMAFFSQGLLFLVMLCYDFGPLSLRDLAFFFMPFAWIISLFFGLALTVIIAKRSSGDDIGHSQALSLAFAKLLPGIGAGAVFTVISCLGLLFFVVPGLYWITVFCFFPFAVILEDKGVWGSFQRSRDLVQGYRRKVAGAHLAVLLSVCAIVLPFILGMKLLWVPRIYQSIFTDAVGILTLPLLTAFYYQLYLYLRNSKETTSRIAVYDVK